MCSQTSFKEACIHAGTMHDRDQSRCNRSVRRPRTRPPGDRHQMLDVGWSRAEEPITGHRSRRSATCDTEGGPTVGLVLGNRRGSVCDHAWGTRYGRKGHSKSKLAGLTRCFREKIITLDARFVNCFLFSNFHGLIFDRFESNFKNR